MKPVFQFCKNAMKHQLIRFFLVGALNTLFSYCIFAFLIWVGISYPWALFIGSVLGVLFNFKTYGRLVFNSRNNKLIGRFFLVYAIVYLFNYVGLRIFLHVGINNYIGGAILAIPGGLLGFLLNKTFVFPSNTTQSTIPLQEVQSTK